LFINLYGHLIYFITFLNIFFIFVYTILVRGDIFDKYQLLFKLCLSKRWKMLL